MTTFLQPGVSSIELSLVKNSGHRKSTYFVSLSSQDSLEEESSSEDEDL